MKSAVFHTLRHTYASWLAESGVDLYTVKNLLGHSTITMTERYSHLGNNTLQNAVKVFEEGLTNKNIPMISITAHDQKIPVRESPSQ